jgi:hypothetical protein
MVRRDARENYNYKYPTVSQLKGPGVSSRILLDAGSLFFTPVDAFRPQPEVKQGDLADAVTTLTVARPTYNDPGTRRVAAPPASMREIISQVRLRLQQRLPDHRVVASNDMRAVFATVFPTRSTPTTPVQFSQYRAYRSCRIAGAMAPADAQHGTAFRASAAGGGACQPATTWVTERQCPDERGVRTQRRGAAVLGDLRPVR